MIKNEINTNSLINTESLSDKEFYLLSKFIEDNTGIKMPFSKKIMLQTRLFKRLKALNINNFETYIKYLFSQEGQTNEIVHFFDIISTNKTDFFREPQHFKYLEQHIQKLLLNKNDIFFKIWSAGCSSGEEPYSIAITLNELITNEKTFNYTIVATDISLRMLNIAKKGIYSYEKVKHLPPEILKKYFLKGINKEEGNVRIKPELQFKITFKYHNLLQEVNEIKFPTYDFIFCRNVLIYFNKENQFKVLCKLCNNLKKGGILFIGHSESIFGFPLPLKNIKPSIYLKI